MKIITLLTDFGTKDPYAGIMKGVILSINPGVTIVDITHEVDPQDIREGAFIVEEYYRYFPDDTVHLCVVDPTVGSNRRPIIVTKDNHFFVGPDNGIFTLLYKSGYEAYEIDTVSIANMRGRLWQLPLTEGATQAPVIESPEFMRREVSSTFHGRDIFAPAAAYLSTGFHPSAFGRMIPDTVRFADISPVIEDNCLVGEVVRFDRFGNAITNIHVDTLERFIQGRSFTISINDLSFTTICKSYYENDYTCLTGSSGYLEFGYYRGNLREKKGILKGQAVTVIPA
ncbi:MAG: SAM-dependent chlorinase/fluorinase [Syntrophorhabdaceae bacterium]|nr:SAM-dependent chlorinase/fluorinase [Syntrophorhabdaceae bacterium]MDD5242517.1 SAM-dependent chlorinase/fluorinase [Syntrophorhabdaceae bacterium]